MGIAGAARLDWCDRRNRCDRIARRAGANRSDRTRRADGLDRRTRTHGCDWSNGSHRTARANGCDGRARSAGGVSRDLLRVTNLRGGKCGLLQRLELHFASGFEFESRAGHQQFAMGIAGTTRKHRGDRSAGQHGSDGFARPDRRDGTSRCDGPNGSRGSDGFARPDRRAGSHRRDGSDRAHGTDGRDGAADQFSGDVFGVHDVRGGCGGFLQRVELHFDGGFEHRQRAGHQSDKMEFVGAARFHGRDRRNGSYWVRRRNGSYGTARTNRCNRRDGIARSHGSNGRDRTNRSDGSNGTDRADGSNRRDWSSD
jgi:hypothetical protein